jgi:hypothetical protein
MAEPTPLDRDLLRQSGEHLGTLAERAKERLDLNVRFARRRNPSSKRAYEQYAKLARLSREVLEIANG